MAGHRTRKAILPAAGYARPASLDDSGLKVTVYEEDDTVAGVCDFTRLPGSTELRRAFAIAVDCKSGPGGTWRSYATCRYGLQVVRVFLTHLAGRENPPQSPQEITASAWTAWRVSLPASREGHSKLQVMRGLMPLVPGVPTGTLQVVNRRVPSTRRTAPASYSYAEYEQIRARAAVVFNTALVRIRGNREHLRRWYGGLIPEGTDGWLLGRALHIVLTTGDVPLVNRRAHHSRTLLPSYTRVLGGSEPEVTWGRLYLTHDEILAAAVLLVASQAWNLSVLNRMQVPEHDPATGDDFAIYTVEISKRRRPVRLRYTTNNLFDSGPGSPGRLMGQVIEATELARQTLELRGRPTNRLLVWRRAHLGGAVGGEPFGLTLPRTNRDGDYEPGDPAGVSLQRLRRTVQVLIRKEPAQNTQATHDDVYVLRDPQIRGEAQDTVAQGLTDAAGHARATVKMRMLLDGDASRLVELADDPGLAQAIGAGEYDTATGACTGLTSSPFTEPGLPCTASFLLCLSCPNAVATRRHLPRLTYLHDALIGLRAVLETPVWDQDWREPFACLDSLLTAHTTASERDAERARITPGDQSLVDRMLRRRLEAR